MRVYIGCGVDGNDLARWDLPVLLSGGISDIASEGVYEKRPRVPVVDGCDPWPDGPASTPISVISGIESECVYWQGPRPSCG